MNDFPRWKYTLVAVAILLGLLYAMPNVFRPQPAVQISANRGAVIDDALKEKVKFYLDQAKIGSDSIEIANERLLVRLPKIDGQNNVLNEAADAIKSGFVKDERGDAYVVALNQASTVPKWLRAIGANSMPLGLDLQGGVHFLMQVDDKEVFEKQQQRYIDDIRGLLRDKNVRYQSVGRGPQGIVVQLRSSEDRDAAAAAITVASPNCRCRTALWSATPTP